MIGELPFWFITVVFGTAALALSFLMRDGSWRRRGQNLEAIEKIIKDRTSDARKEAKAKRAELKKSLRVIDGDVSVADIINDRFKK